MEPVDYVITQLPWIVPVALSIPIMAIAGWVSFS